MTGRTGNAVALLGNNENGQELSWLKPTDVYQTSVVTDIGWTNDKPPARTKYVPSGEGVG